MQLHQLRFLHQIGQLSHVKVLPRPEGGWLLQAHLPAGKTVIMIKSKPDSKDKQYHERVFTTVDAAVQAAGKIGFSEITVGIPETSATESEDFKLT